MDLDLFLYILLTESKAVGQSLSIKMFKKK